MKFTGEFEVKADAGSVFDFLTDAHRMASLVPDVENMEVTESGDIRMTVRVGLSFIKGRFNLRMRILNRIPKSHAEIQGSGSGSGSSVDFHGYCDISEEQGRSRVKWSADVTIGGLAATMGSRMVQNASEKYIAQLVESFRKAFEK